MTTLTRFLSKILFGVLICSSAYAATNGVWVEDKLTGKPVSVDSSGNLKISIQGGIKGSTSSVTTVSDTATSATLKAANANRVQLSITNDSSSAMYILLDSGTASATNYTYRLAQYGTAIIDNYTGQVNGVWATDPNDGAARIAEIT